MKTATAAKLDIYEFGRQLVRTNDPNGWCRVVGFPKYLINLEGVVRTTHKRSRSPGGVLKLVLDKDGYLIAGLWNDNTKRQERHFVHKLMLLTFVGPRPRGMEVCHKDGVRTNNRITNLRWDTPKGNHADAVASGTHSGFAKHGENNPFAKLSASDVIEIRRLRRVYGLKYKELAERFGILPGHASLIVRRKVWIKI